MSAGSGIEAPGKPLRRPAGGRAHAGRTRRAGSDSVRGHASESNPGARWIVQWSMCARRSARLPARILPSALLVTAALLAAAVAWGEHRVDTSHGHSKPIVVRPDRDLMDVPPTIEIGG